MYNTRIEIELEPVGSPTVLITAGVFMEQATIDRPVTRVYDINQQAGNLKISVEMLGKDDNDPTTAVIIKSLKFNDITDPKFLWAGAYYPNYPKHFADQLDLKLALPGQTYLSWNGVYELTVTVPIFTWMHQIMELGWVFE
jgi:hypothetical protein